MKDKTILSEGGYGCIVGPPKLTCAGKQSKDTRYISKIQRINFFSENEIYVASLIKSISDYENYFGVIEQHCKIELRKITNKKIVSDCKETLQKTTTALLGQIKFIKNKNIYEIFTSLNSQNLIATLINTFLLTLVSLKKLEEAKIIHFDIKPGNVLFDLDKNVPIIIDFGISISKAKLNKSNYKKHFYIFYPKYSIWCLDIHYICYLLHINKSPKLHELISIVDEYVDNNNVFTMFSDHFINQYKRLCVRKLKRYIGSNVESVIKELLKYSFTWDAYSFATIYLKIIDIWFSKGFNKNKFIIHFSELLLNCIHPDPEERLSLDELSSEFSGFFYKKDNYEDILNIVDSIDENKPDVYSKLKNVETQYKKLRSIIRTKSQKVN